MLQRINEVKAKKWRKHLIRISVGLLEICFCVFIAWAMFLGFINCPLVMEKNKAQLFVLCSAGLSIAVSGLIYLLIKFNKSLEEENEKLEEERLKLEIRIKTLEEKSRYNGKKKPKIAGRRKKIRG